MTPEPEKPLTELELLLTDEQRATRRVSVEEHLRFQQALINDLIDDELVEIDPYVSGANNRRSDKELSRMLDLIDNLPISTSGKEGQA